MVSQAINEELVERIKRYVANDMTSHLQNRGMGGGIVKPENIQVILFSRVLNNWKANVKSPEWPDAFYELIHDGLYGKTVVNVYTRRSTYQAII